MSDKTRQSLQVRPSFTVTFPANLQYIREHGRGMKTHISSDQLTNQERNGKKKPIPPKEYVHREIRLYDAQI